MAALNGPAGLTTSADWIGNASAAGLAWLAFILACVGLLLAIGGALVGASLLVYSPAKLLKKLKNGKRGRVVPDLQTNEDDYEVVARCVALGGLVLLLLGVLWWTTSPIGWLLWCAVTMLLYGVLPSAIAERRAEAVVTVAQPILRNALPILRYPVIVPLRATTRLLLRALGIRDVITADREDIAEDILAAVEDSATENSLEAAE